MKCSDFLSVLHDYLDGETDRQTEKQIKEHLATCEACRRALKEMEAVKAATVKAGDIPVPEGMAEEVLGAIQNEIENGKVRFHLPAFFTSWPLYVSIAACLVLFFVLKDSYQRQFESYIYTQESGAVAVSDTGNIAQSRIAPNNGVFTADEGPAYPPVSALVKHAVTFKTSSPAAEAVFLGAKAGGTDAVIRALTEENIAFSIEYGIAKDCTADYNKLAEEASALFVRLSEGDSNAAVSISQKETEMNALKNDCAVPELKIVLQVTTP